MGLGASLMFGWTVLLLWAYRGFPSLKHQSLVRCLILSCHCVPQKQLPLLACLPEGCRGCWTGLTHALHLEVLIL